MECRGGCFASSASAQLSSPQHRLVFLFPCSTTIVSHMERDREKGEQGQSRAFWTCCEVLIEWSLAQIELGYMLRDQEDDAIL